MAEQVRITNSIQCDVATFWAKFLDEALSRQLFSSDLGFPVYRLVDRTETPTKIRRRVEIMPKADIPAAVAKVIGERFSYCEVGEFEKTASVYRFKLLPPAGISADKATSEGVMRAETLAGGTTQQRVELTIEVRMFGLGGMLERFGAKLARDGYDAHARALNAHLTSAPRI